MAFITHRFALSARLAAVLVGLALCGNALQAGPPKNAAQIVFLHLRLNNGDLTLVESSIRPGTLKDRERPEQVGKLLYDVVSATGLPLWSGSTDDPSRRRYEYEDPENAGRLKVKFVVLDDVEFTVRVPLFAEARRVVFFRMDSTVRIPLTAESSRTLVGSIDLPR